MAGHSGPAPRFCPTCGAVLVVRSSKSGKFVCCPKSYKGNNHGTWAFKPEAPDPDPALPRSGLRYPHTRPDPEPEPALNPPDADWTMERHWHSGEPKTAAEV